MSKAFGQILAESTQIEEEGQMSQEARKAKQFENRKKKVLSMMSSHQTTG